jgi:hypothetical protein
MKINCVLLGTFVIGVSFYACDLHAKEARATYFATAHCPMTGVTGTGRAANSSAATDLASQNCITKGGMPACCRKFITVKP